jgi:hypothetical protein
VIEAYWQIGRIILARQQAAGWGANEHLHLVTLTWIPRSLCPSVLEAPDIERYADSG